MCELLGGAGLAIAPRVLAERLDAIRLGAGAVLVALEWGPPSGIVVVHWHRMLDAEAPVAWITALLVAPDDRRRGIGRLLVKAAAQAARVAGCGTLALLAGPEQPALDAFCQATGFAESGRHFVRPLRKRA